MKKYLQSKILIEEDVSGKSARMTQPKSSNKAAHLTQIFPCKQPQILYLSPRAQELYKVS